MELGVVQLSWRNMNMWSRTYNWKKWVRNRECQDKDFIFCYSPDKREPLGGMEQKGGLLKRGLGAECASNVLQCVD